METRAPTVGLVGLGEIHEHHALALGRTPGLRVTAVADPDSSRAARVREARRFPDHRELIRSGGVDAVIVATGTGLHHEVARDCLAAGLHVLLEKPACVTRAQLTDLYGHADRAGVRLVVAFHDAVSEEVLRLRDGLLDELVERRGPVESVRQTFVDAYSAPERAGRRASLVGSWLDNGSNALSVACSLVGALRVRRATFRTSDPSDAASRDIGADVALGVPDRPGLGVRIRTCWIRTGKRKRTVVRFADRSRMVIDHLQMRVTEPRGRDVFRASPGLPRLASQYARIFADFAEQIRDGRDNRRFAWQVHEPLFAALELEGRP